MPVCLRLAIMLFSASIVRSRMQASGGVLVRPPQVWRGFSVLKGELVVGGVYVRVYNSLPQTLPADAPGFCKALVRCVCQGCF